LSEGEKEVIICLLRCKYKQKQLYLNRLFFW